MISIQPEPIAEVISAVALVALKGRDRAAYRRVTDESLRRCLFPVETLEAFKRIDYIGCFLKMCFKSFHHFLKRLIAEL